MVPGVVGSSPITHPRQDRGSGLPRSPVSFHIGASPSGKARDFDSLIRWFESSRPSHPFTPRKNAYDPVAQQAEQLPFKQWVRGSNPRRVTTSSRTSYRSRRLFYLKVKSHRSFIPSLLLSKSNPLRWASIWFWQVLWGTASIVLRLYKNRFKQEAVFCFSEQKAAYILREAVRMPSLTRPQSVLYNLQYKFSFTQFA